MNIEKEQEILNILHRIENGLLRLPIMTIKIDNKELNIYRNYKQSQIKIAIKEFMNNAKG